MARVCSAIFLLLSFEHPSKVSSKSTVSLRHEESDVFRHARSSWQARLLLRSRPLTSKPESLFHHLYISLSTTNIFPLSTTFLGFPIYSLSHSYPHSSRANSLIATSFTETFEISSHGFSWLSPNYVSLSGNSSSIRTSCSAFGPQPR
jgi:hypothetical protein